MEKLVRIDCCLEFVVKGEMNHTELIDKVREQLNAMTPEQIGKKVQIEPMLRKWHIFDENENEEYNRYGTLMDDEEVM